MLLGVCRFGGGGRYDASGREIGAFVPFGIFIVHCGSLEGDALPFGVCVRLWAWLVRALPAGGAGCLHIGACVLFGWVWPIGRFGFGCNLVGGFVGFA